jgi:RNA polymerase sigma factor (sigma-70 family)
VKPERAPIVDPEFELVDRYCSGDAVAERAIFCTYYPLLLARARRVIYWDPLRAENAAVRVMRHFMLKLPVFRKQCKVRTYFNRVVEDRLPKYVPHRRPDQSPTVEADSLEEIIADPVSDFVARAALRQRIEAAADRLPADLKQAFLMRVVEGRDYDEIAGAIGETRAAACERVYRARGLMKWYLRNGEAV